MLEYKDLSSIVYANAWNELYKLFGERLDQENLDIMDSVLKGVVAEMEDENLAFMRSDIETDRDGGVLR